MIRELKQILLDNAELSYSEEIDIKAAKSLQDL